MAAAQRRHPHQPPVARRHAPVRRRRRGGSGRDRLRRRRPRCCSGWPGAAGACWAWTPGRSGIPDADWVSDEAGSHHLYWTEPRVIGGADPVPLGSNNSGRGVGGSMVHYAGDTPRFHPSDFATFTNDGVGADWPIGYADLRPYYPRPGGRAAGGRVSTGRGASRTPTRTARTRSAATARFPARRGRGPGSRPRSARWRSATAGSGTGRTASTAASACRAARSTRRRVR